MAHRPKYCLNRFSGASNCGSVVTGGSMRPGIVRVYVHSLIDRQSSPYDYNFKCSIIFWCDFKSRIRRFTKKQQVNKKPSKSKIKAKSHLRYTKAGAKCGHNKQLPRPTSGKYRVAYGYLDINSRIPDSKDRIIPRFCQAFALFPLQL